MIDFFEVVSMNEILNNNIANNEKSIVEKKLTSEMETAALFTVSAVRNIRAGSILHAIWNQERRKSGDNSENINTENAVLTAIEALKIIIAEDKMIN